MQFNDNYQALGVARDATAEQIKKAFRRLARKYHPDLSKEPAAEARMKEINEANAVLSDPEKRAAYDALAQGRRFGEEFRPPPYRDAGFEFSGRGPTAAEAAEFSDFFAELFGRMGAGRAREGIPGNPPDDLKPTVRAVLPAADTPRAKKIYETMARELKFDPRAKKGA